MITNPRQERLVEDFLRRVLPVALTKGTLRQPSRSHDARLIHYRGPVGIHLIIETKYSDSGISFINIRRGKEWSISFNCQPKPGVCSFQELTHTTASGDVLKHKPSVSANLPFFKASSDNLSIKRESVGRGRIIPTYVNLAYWMVEFGEIRFIEAIVNIAAAERDLTILLMEIS